MQKSSNPREERTTETKLFIAAVIGLVMVGMGMIFSHTLYVFGGLFTIIVLMSSCVVDVAMDIRASRQRKARMMEELRRRGYYMDS